MIRSPTDRQMLWQPLRRAVLERAAADPMHHCFGASQHRYHLRAALTEARLLEIEMTAQIRLPEDYRDFLLEIGDGIAGPYYGLFPLDHPTQLSQLGGSCELGAGAEPAASTLWQGVVALCHLGCGYIAYLIVEGSRRGQIWLDASAVGAVALIAPHFIAFYSAWLRALERAQWPQGYVGPGQCALAQSLSGYLSMVERRLGRPAGELSVSETQQAFCELGRHSIRLLAHGSRSPLLPRDSAVGPCLRCEQLLLALAPSGLSRDTLAPADLSTGSFK
jgi:hypothetical protein